MGKKGAALRAAKKQSATYTFTGAQLEEHDRQVREAYREDLRPRMMEAAKAAAKQYEAETVARINAEWDARAKEFNTEDANENFINLLSYLLAVSSRVLIEKFHWKPIPKDGNYDRRNRTMRYAECLVNEIQRIAGDEKLDIRKYNEETYQLYGVKYTAKEE